MPRVLFITGFPGFIGRRLVRALLQADPEAQVVALVEEKQIGRAQECAQAIDGGRIELLTGDISQQGLGLDAATHERLQASVVQVFHLAAIYNLAVPADIAGRVNVDGTGNILDLCAACSQLERLNYVSTAYVAGDRTGVVYEHELALGQRFKNHYESTKFQAEVWVRDLMDRIPTTILRPAIVVGDSRTGETEKFDGPYYLLRAISRANRYGRAIVQFGASDANFNVVPVDFVVAAIATAASADETVNETLHLVDPEPLTTRDLVVLLSQTYAGRPPMGKLPPGLVAASLGLRAVRDALGGTPRESLAYLNHRVTFDTRRAVDLLGRHGLTPPRFQDYVEPMVEFFRAHEDDPAFVPRR